MKKEKKTRFRKKREAARLVSHQAMLRKELDDLLHPPRNAPQNEYLLLLRRLVEDQLWSAGDWGKHRWIIDNLDSLTEPVRQGNRITVTGYLIRLAPPNFDESVFGPFQARLFLRRRGRMKYDIRFILDGLAWRVTEESVRRGRARPGLREIPDLKAFREILLSHPAEVSLFSNFDPVRVRGWKPHPTTETDWVQYQRSGAARCIGHFGEAGLKTLAEALDSDRPEVSAAALDACGRLGKTAQPLWPRVFEHFLQGQTLDFRWRVALVAHTMTETESNVPEIVVRFAHELWSILERQNRNTESPIDLKNELLTVRLLARVTLFDADFRKRVLTTSRDWYVVFVLESVGRDLLKKLDAETETR